MTIFDGKHHASILDNYIKTKISSISRLGVFLIVLIGDNPVSLKYINIKKKLFESFGILVSIEQLSTSLSDSEIINQVTTYFDDTSVTGGLIQIPIPRKSLSEILNLIPAEKDVDIISSTNIERFNAGDLQLLTPVIRAFNYYMLYCMLGAAEDLESYIDKSKATALLKENLKNNSVTLIGDGKLVGAPINTFLHHLNCNPHVNLNYKVGDSLYSDFLVLGAGVPNLVKGESISENCNVLDFGISVVDQKVIGDFDKNSKTDHLGVVSFSPGGIGPVVVRFLLLNFLGL